MTDTEYQHLVTSMTEEIWQRLREADGRWSPRLTLADGRWSPRLTLADDGPAHSCGCTHTEIEMLLHSGACRVAVHQSSPPVDPQTAVLIDHTLLKPEATRVDITKVCDEAVKYSFASVCVNPYWVPLVAERLRCSPVKVCTVVGFPLGATFPAAKAAEAAEAIKLGAQEVDMVINVGALRSGDWDLVRLDIRGVVEVCHAAGVLTKVILETCLLNDEEKVAGCLLSRAAGADFVKTSTGFAGGGATAHDVELMRFVVGEGLGVKASGGVRSLDDVKKLVAAGASRIGASASVKIMEEASGKPQPAPSPGGKSAY